MARGFCYREVSNTNLHLKRECLLDTTGLLDMGAFIGSFTVCATSCILGFHYANMQ